MAFFSQAIGIGASLIGAGQAKKAQQRGAQAELARGERAAELLNFAPVRIRSGFGDASLTSAGEFAFAPSAEFAERQSDISDFFGDTTRALAAFRPEDASAQTLALLRRRRAEQFDPALSRLESRLASQGRLGLATGARGANPELAGFFGAEADADLAAQLAADEEARRQQKFLIGSAGAGLDLFGQSQVPLFGQLTGLFGQQLARTGTQAGFIAGGAAAAGRGAAAGPQARADFWSGIAGAF